LDYIKLPAGRLEEIDYSVIFVIAIHRTDEEIILNSVSGIPVQMLRGIAMTNTALFST
jgi:hypothetical protein